MDARTVPVTPTTATGNVTCRIGLQERGDVIKFYNHVRIFLDHMKHSSLIFFRLNHRFQNSCKYQRKILPGEEIINYSIELINTFIQHTLGYGS